MCLLIVCEPGHQPTEAELNRGSCANPHGFGFAMVAGDEIIHRRGMSAKKINAEFLRLRAEHPNGWAIWHSRYATHGVKNESNCHPYPMGDDGLTYLAHNGVLDQPIPAGDKRSDSRVFAEDTLPAMGGVRALNNDTVRAMVSEWAGSSKIAILTLDPVAEYQVIILNENLGTWVEGVWYSNGSHKPPVVYDYPLYSVPSKSWTTLDEVFDDPIEFECPECLSSQSFEDCMSWCSQCGICFECQDHVSACLCWAPGEESYKAQALRLYAY